MHNIIIDRSGMFQIKYIDIYDIRETYEEHNIVLFVKRTHVV